MPSPSTKHTPPAELHALNLIRRAYDKKGYAFFAKKPYDLNLGGIRNPNAEPDRFDDSFFVAFIDSRWTWRVAMWACTTDPGIYWLDERADREGKLNKEGTAILIPGQYRSCWRIGLHNGKYPALVQNGRKFRVWRDLNKDGMLDRSGKVFTNVTGLNCHKAKNWEDVDTASGKKTKVGLKSGVNKYSAGCQVSEVSYAHDYVLMPLARQQSRSGNGSTFSYTLFEAADFEGL